MASTTPSFTKKRMLSHGPKTNKRVITQNKQLHPNTVSCRSFLIEVMQQQMTDGEHTQTQRKHTSVGHNMFHAARKDCRTSPCSSRQTKLRGIQGNQTITQPQVSQVAQTNHTNKPKPTSDSGDNYKRTASENEGSYQQNHRVLKSYDKRGIGKINAQRILGQSIDSTAASDQKESVIEGGNRKLRNTLMVGGRRNTNKMVDSLQQLRSVFTQKITETGSYKEASRASTCTNKNVPDDHQVKAEDSHSIYSSKTEHAQEKQSHNSKALNTFLATCSHVEKKNMSRKNTVFTKGNAFRSPSPLQIYSRSKSIESTKQATGKDLRTVIPKRPNSELRKRTSTGFESPKTVTWKRNLTTKPYDAEHHNVGKVIPKTRDEQPALIRSPKTNASISQRYTKTIKESKDNTIFLIKGRNDFPFHTFNQPPSNTKKAFQRQKAPTPFRTDHSRMMPNEKVNSPKQLDNQFAARCTNLGDKRRQNAMSQSQDISNKIPQNRNQTPKRMFHIPACSPLKTKRLGTGVKEQISKPVRVQNNFSHKRTRTLSSRPDLSPGFVKVSRLCSIISRSASLASDDSPFALPQKQSNQRDGLQYVSLDEHPTPSSPHHPTRTSIKRVMRTQSLSPPEICKTSDLNLYLGGSPIDHKPLEPGHRDGKHNVSVNGFEIDISQYKAKCKTENDLCVLNKNAECQTETSNRDCIMKVYPSESEPFLSDEKMKLPKTFDKGIEGTLDGQTNENVRKVNDVYVKVKEKSRAGGNNIVSNGQSLSRNRFCSTSRENSKSPRRDSSWDRRSFSTERTKKKSACGPVSFTSLRAQRRKDMKDTAAEKRNNSLISKTKQKVQAKHQGENKCAAISKQTKRSKTVIGLTKHTDLLCGWQGGMDSEDVSLLETKATLNVPAFENNSLTCNSISRETTVLSLQLPRAYDVQTEQSDMSKDFENKCPISDKIENEKFQISEANNTTTLCENKVLKESVIKVRKYLTSLDSANQPQIANECISKQREDKCQTKKRVQETRTDRMHKRAQKVYQDEIHDDSIKAKPIKSSKETSNVSNRQSNEGIPKSEDKTYTEKKKRKAYSRLGTNHNPDPHTKITKQCIPGDKDLDGIISELTKSSNQIIERAKNLKNSIVELKTPKPQVQSSIFCKISKTQLDPDVYQSDKNDNSYAMRDYLMLFAFMGLQLLIQFIYVKR